MSDSREENAFFRVYGEEVKIGELQHHVFIYKLYNAKSKQYRAYCGGSIIAEKRVLSSANCFLTNRKRIRTPLEEIRVAAGILETIAVEIYTHADQQWRSIEKIYSQRFYKFPAYDLAVVELKKAFEFNGKVNKIAYAAKNNDYDGVCVSTVLRPTTGWAEKKVLFTEQLQMVMRHDCERTLLRSCRLFYCTSYKARYIYSEVEGAGLVCHGTDDPEDKGKGVLIGVTSLININLPSLHHRVAIFHSWIKDGGIILKLDKMVGLLCLGISLVKLL